MPVDAVSLEVFKNLLASVAEEMGVALGRTGFSPNIKERKDYSCALFDPQGRMVAQASHIPVHLGAMPASVEAALHGFDFAPGDIIALNDPYLGGTHLNDVTLVAPVFAPTKPVRSVGAIRESPASVRPEPTSVVRPEGNRRANEGSAAETPSPSRGKGGMGVVGFVANRAHHADIGGMTPGSLPRSTELFQEGFIIPPLKLVRAGHVNEEVVALFCRNSRTPDERRGDLAAQIAACRTGERRLQEMVAPLRLARRRRARGRPPRLLRAPHPRRHPRPPPTATTPSPTSSTTTASPTTPSPSPSPSPSAATLSPSTSPTPPPSAAAASTPPSPSPSPPPSTSSAASSERPPPPTRASSAPSPSSRRKAPSSTRARPPPSPAATSRPPSASPTFSSAPSPKPCRMSSPPPARAP